MKRPDFSINIVELAACDSDNENAYMHWEHVLDYIEYLESKTSTPDVHTNIITPPSRL